jgi:hypothetical protein
VFAGQLGLCDARNFSVAYADVADRIQASFGIDRTATSDYQVILLGVDRNNQEQESRQDMECPHGAG